MPLRYQLASYSPLSLRHLMGSTAGAVHPARSRERLTRLLRERHGGRPVAITNSGTQALQLAIEIASKQTAGRPVALPAYSCFDLASAVIGADAPVSFYDVDPVTLTPDTESVERVLSGGAGSLVAGYLYGLPIDWDTLRARCRAHGTLLIEDAAQGGGTHWGGRPAGGEGQLTILSFGRGKGWTGGGGGALLVHDDALVAGAETAVRELEPSGSAGRAVAAVAQWALGRPGLYGLPRMVPGLGLGETHYHPPTAPALNAGYAAELTLRQADAATREQAARQERAGRWIERLGSVLEQESGYLCRPVAGGRPGWLRLPLVTGHVREAERLVREFGACGVAPGYPMPLPGLDHLRDRTTAGPDRYPGAEVLAERLVTLPTHSRVTRRDVERIASGLRSPATVSSEGPARPAS